MKPWYRFQNVADDPTAVDIHIIDFIGGWIDDMINRYYNEEIGVTARAFVEQLAQLPATVTALRVHINSPGGDVQGGINIANALREQSVSKGRAVTTYVDGIAASIASVIAMAGQKVVMADNALMMIHNPWSWQIGNAAEMRKTADVLDTMREQIVATYKWHTKDDLSDVEIKTLMDDETWMTADEALAYGFATEKVEGLKAAASITRNSLKTLKVPEQHRARVEACLQPAASDDECCEHCEHEDCEEACVHADGHEGRHQCATHAETEDAARATRRDRRAQAATAEELLPLCQQAGCSVAFVQDLVGAKLPLARARARIEADRTQRAEAGARATQIRGACTLAKVPALADGYIASNMTLQAVKAHLTTVTALVDGRLATDGSLQPDQAPDVGASWKSAFSRTRTRAQRAGVTKH
ncbi:MAG: head maturation protease, ClpP-related [Vicinamibacterales bacterium]